MTTIERISGLCDERGITLAKLERDLGYSNGSVAKVKALKGDRVLAIAKYFNVSPEFLLTGSDDPVKKVNEEIDASYNDIMRNVEGGIYLDADILNLSQQMKDSPERRKLFKLSSRVKPDDIALVCSFLERITSEGTLTDE